MTRARTKPHISKAALVWIAGRIMDARVANGLKLGQSPCGKAVDQALYDLEMAFYKAADATRAARARGRK